MSIQVFVDESGVDDAGPVLTFAAVIGTSEAWSALSDKWQAVLDEPPAVQKFSMRRAAHSRKMAGKLHSLVPIMNAYPFRVLGRACDLDDFKRILKPVSYAPLNQPYFWMFSDMILRVTYELLARGQAEPYEIFFDEQMMFGPKAQAWYPQFRQIMKAQAPEAFPILPVEPVFKTDDEFKPLQVADIFAWLLRRMLAKKTHEFAWVGEQLTAIGMSSLSGMWMDKETLQRRVETLNDPKQQQEIRQFINQNLADFQVPKKFDKSPKWEPGAN